MTDYEALVAAGHSPARAKEIELDAERGDQWAKRWIACIRRLLREEVE